MGRQEESAPKLGRVIIYGNPNYRWDRDAQDWTKQEDEKNIVTEILDVQALESDRIVTSKYVLPLSDAAISNSDEGLVYSYNASLPYLTETAHMADVEQNIIVQQAFLYAGRTQPVKTPIFMILLVAFMGLMALIGMFK